MDSNKTSDMVHTVLINDPIFPTFCCKAIFLVVVDGRPQQMQTIWHEWTVWRIWHMRLLRHKSHYYFIGETLISDENRIDLNYLETTV